MSESEKQLKQFVKCNPCTSHIRYNDDEFLALDAEKEAVNEKRKQRIVTVPGHKELSLDEEDK